MKVTVNLSENTGRPASPPAPTPSLSAGATVRRHAVLALLTTAVAAVAAVAAGTVAAGDASSRPPLPIDPMCRYDCGWYLSIADQGYTWSATTQSPVPFFPTFPMLIRAGSALGVPPVAVAHVIAFAAGLAAVLLFWRWAHERLDPPTAAAAVSALLVYPYAIYLYGAIYADALFLASTLAAFLCVERRWWWAAAAFGAVATATRPLGVGVVVGLTVRMLELRAQDGSGAERVGWRELLRAVPGRPWHRYAVLLSGLGLLGYAAFLGAAFGEPLAFVKAESAPGWDQGVGVKVWLKASFLVGLMQGRPETAVLLPQAFVVLVTLLMLPVVWRRLGWGYTAYTAVLVSLPLLGSKDFMGSGRYLINAFPVFAAVGVVISQWCSPSVRRVLAGLSLAGGLTAAYLFGKGVLIA
jgi:hypothetical protein